MQLGHEQKYRESRYFIKPYTFPVNEEENKY
jgi:hypothetical protein